MLVPLSDCFSSDMSMAAPSLGLELLFLPLLDLVSDLEDPLTILVIFWTVFSVIDSDLDTFSLLLDFSFVDLSSLFAAAFSVKPLGEHSQPAAMFFFLTTEAGF